MESSPATGFSLEGIDDVYDFPWNEEGSSMSLERYGHLYDLMQRGNTAFREDRLDQRTWPYALGCCSVAMDELLNGVFYFCTEGSLTLVAQKLFIGYGLGLVEHEQRSSFRTSGILFKSCCLLKMCLGRMEARVVGTLNILGIRNDICLRLLLVKLLLVNFGNTIIIFVKFLRFKPIRLAMPVDASLAIELYSRANHIKPGDSIILSNRCAAYLRISQFLRSRSPSASEYRPLNGLDPTTHAGLALNDAEKVMNLHNNSAASYILKANALILLEKYELAQDVIRSGLQIDPQSNALSNLEKKIANTFLRRSHSNPQRTDDYDCTLCLKLLFEPITTPCGHSFCRSCLFQTMDRGATDVPCVVLFCLLVPEHVQSVNPHGYSLNWPGLSLIGICSVTLNNIIEKSFPEEYAERKLEHLSLTNPGPDLLPLFAMDVILPCQKLQLNIFEPRYRLMVRRIMEGNRRMGMVVIDPSTGSVVDYACEVEITDCEPLPDGRFFLEVESRRRCCIIRNWDQDGYRVAEVEWVNDTYLPEGNERNDLLEMTNKAAVFVRQWMKEAQEAAQGDRIRLAELFKAEGLIPSTRDPERFSFWLATLTNRRPSERLELLRLRDTRERITRCLLFMKAEEQGCRLIWQ
ncbi:hypothetical protein SASPL_124967 [Salvia splendens]|uniref:LON peptidase N-terminal domain and RING finger protein 1 n=1 Tax=Salvia splendens TaxID=180675 RepID=A0A8X8ZNT0_SALSN|nr:hypothetical protein SASPL_124967 [Salvia splendens]